MNFKLFVESTVPIDMLLETNTGFIEKNNIKTGDIIYVIAK